MRARQITVFAAALLMAISSTVSARNEPPPCRVTIETVPADAAVYCDGVLKGNAPATFVELPGEHVFSATKDGHNEVRKSATLTPGQSMTLKLTLEPVQGLVLIQSEPSGTDVQINGADRGKTPLLLADLPLGKHRVRFSKAGCIAKEMDLDLKDRIPTKLKALLASDSGTLVVDSTPAGANVTIDGLSKGTTPCTVEQVKAGEHTVEISLDGYSAFKQAIKMSAGEREEIKTNLKAVPAQLNIESLPPQARIYVDDQFRGEAPLKLPDVLPGEHRIRAELKGFEPVARTVTLTSGQSTTEEFRMSSDSGMLELITQPAGVNVKIDGESVGVTKPKGGEDQNESEPLSVELLSVGTHQIDLSKPGWFDSSFTVEVSKEETTTHRESLKRNFAPDYEVRTEKEVIQGVLIGVSANGDVKLETKPGIFRTVSGDDIRVKRPLNKPKTGAVSKDQKDSN